MDIRLHCTQAGSGSPLVLLHGNGESSDYFVNQTGVFSKYFRVIAVDTRGHGRSPRGTAPFTLGQFADDLKDLLDSLGVAKADILGFSDGGNIALLFALKYPGYVDHLILSGANLYPAGIRLPFLITILFSWCRYAALSRFSAHSRRQMELYTLMIREPHIRPSALHALASPTLVMAGTRDMIRRGHTQRIARSLPNSTLSILSGSHFIAAENSEAFNSAVLDFLRSPPPAG